MCNFTFIKPCRGWRRHNPASNLKIHCSNGFRGSTARPHCNPHRHPVIRTHVSALRPESQSLNPTDRGCAVRLSANLVSSGSDATISSSHVTSQKGPPMWRTMHFQGSVQYIYTCAIYICANYIYLVMNKPGSGMCLFTHMIRVEKSRSWESDLSWSPGNLSKRWAPHLHGEGWMSALWTADKPGRTWGVSTVSALHTSQDAKPGRHWTTRPQKSPWQSLGLRVMKLINTRNKSG